MPTLTHPIVGKVRWEPAMGDAIRLLDDWASEHITIIHIPQLDGIPTYDGTFNGHVAWYKGTVDQLVAAWEEVARRNLMRYVLFWDGSFVPRRKKGGKSPSNHSFGTAFDINAQWNPFAKAVAPRGGKGCLLDLVPIFKNYGFVWGGDWKTKDGMHFEVASIWHPAPAPKPAPSPKPAPLPPVAGVGILVNGVLLSVTGENRNGTIWVPARPVAMALQIPFGFVTGAKVVTLFDLPVTTDMRDGAAWVQAKQLAEAAGYSARYDAQAHRVTLTPA